MTNYKKILVSVAASAVMFGSLHASTLDLSSSDYLDAGVAAPGHTPLATKADAYFTNNDVNLTALEAATGNDDSAATPPVKTIVYTPSVNIAAGSKLTLKINNGAISNDTLLYFKNANDVTTQLNIDTAASTANVAGTGFSELVFIAQEALPANVELSLSADAATLVEPAIIGNKGLQADQNVTMEIADVTFGGGSNTGAIPATPTNILGVTQAFSSEINDPATSVISVETDRKLFNSDGIDPIVFASNADTNDTTSVSGTIELTDNTAPTLINNVTLTVSTASNCDSILGIKLLSSGGNIVATTDGNSTNCNWIFKGDSAGAGAGDLYHELLPAQGGVRVNIDTNSSAVLEPGTWTTSLDINGSAIGEQSMFTDETTHTWTLDGSQFIVPYLNTNLSYGTYVLMTNTGAKAAGVTLDVYADKGANAGTEQATKVCSNVVLDGSPANSTKLYLPDELNNAIETKCPGFKADNDRYLGKFTVELPVGVIIPTAFQKDAATGGKRSVPVYKPTGIESDASGTTKTGWRE